MLFIYILILLLIKISKEAIEYEDFPLNKEFDKIDIAETNTSIIFFGNIVSYFKIRNNLNHNFTYSNLRKYIFDFNEMNFNIIDDNYNLTINRCIACDKNHSEYINCLNLCIDEYSVGYSEHLYLRLIYLPVIFVFSGIIICLYGRTHYIFSMFFEFIWLFYFLIMDTCQLYGSFDNSVYPSYILGAAFITSCMVSFFGKLGEKNLKVFEAFKIIKGCIIGFFLIKIIFYYVSIYSPINNAVYGAFLFIFLIFGGITEFLLKYKYKTDKLLFMVSSVLSGSVFISRGIGYIVGGYFSDSLTSHYKLEYKDEAKSRMTFFFVLNILLIVCALIFQIIDIKINLLEDSLDRQNSVASSNYSGTNRKVTNPNKDINASDNDLSFTGKNMSLKENFSASSNKNPLVNQNDDNEDINDQDD
jgi:hypothetical protein